MALVGVPRILARCPRAKDSRGDERGKNMMKRRWLFRMAVIAVVAVAVFAFGSADVWAQGATPAPFNKVRVSDEAAKRTLMKAVITADTASAIVDACVEWQKAQPGNVSIAIFVLSPTGQIIDSHQMDGVVPIGAETGLMKGKTVLYARSSSAAVAQRLRDGDKRLFGWDLGRG